MTGASPAPDAGAYVDAHTSVPLMSTAPVDPVRSHGHPLRAAALRAATGMCRRAR